MFRETVVASLLVCACFAAAVPNARAEVAMGQWRMVLAVPGGDLPFFVELQHADSAYTAYLINGAERVPVPAVRVLDNGISLVLPSFDSRIIATVDGGELSGTLRLIKRGGRPQVIPLRGFHDQPYRFVEAPDSALADVSGRWDVTFATDDGEQSKAVGVFEQVGDRLSGTFLTPVGDYRFLEGQVSGREMMLSCFDGGHVFLFKAMLDEDGELIGDFWSGTAWHESWRAYPDADIELPDPNGLTALNPDYDRFEFAFPDANGVDVSLDDDRFEDKVVVVSIAGTWCRNCHDEAAFLAGYYKENRERGVEIIGLMYEHYRDGTQAVRQIQRFRERYGIDYTMLWAGFSDKQEAARTLPMLNHVLAYPTHVFIDRKGDVRRIHTGIAGPATGDEYERYTQEFRAFVDMLLAE